MAQNSVNLMSKTLIGLAAKSNCKLPRKVEIEYFDRNSELMVSVYMELLVLSWARMIKNIFLKEVIVIQTSVSQCVYRGVPPKNDIALLINSEMKFFTLTF